MTRPKVAVVLAADIYGPAVKKIRDAKSEIRKLEEQLCRFQFKAPEKRPRCSNCTR